MRYLVLLVFVGAASAAPSYVAPYPGTVAAVPTSPESAHVAVAGFPPVTYISRHHAQDELGQVNYGFSHPGQVKNEVRDALGNVAGAYSYIDADNKPVHVQYTAGFDGFQVKSNNLPVGPGALDAPEPVRDTPEVFSAKQDFLEAYNSAAVAAAAAPDDEVVLKAAVESGEAALSEGVDDEIETATTLGVIADTYSSGDEEPALVTDEETPVVVETVEVARIDDDATVLFTDQSEPEEKFAAEDVDVKQAPELGEEEEAIALNSEISYTAESTLDGSANVAPLPESDGNFVQTVSIEPVEVQPSLGATDGNAFFRTIEVSELFPTSKPKPVVDTVASDAGITKTDFQVVPVQVPQLFPTLKAEPIVDTSASDAGITNVDIQVVPIQVPQLFPTLKAAPIVDTSASDAGITNADIQVVPVPVPQLFPTLKAEHIVDTSASDAGITKAAFQVVSTAAATAEDTPELRLDSLIPHYSPYISAADGSLSPLYTNFLSYRPYGVNFPTLLPYTASAHAGQTSHVVAQTPMPYYRYIPRNYVYPVPYAAQFLNYVPARNCDAQHES
ncbi:uncharacterized protein [Panulirus ornatus]|uniref:uncharacterized protein n=1 Tax=Panulirus ornatus TaxID=150431 RepID=UPI003A839A81